MAIVPLAIQLLRGNRAILYGLALWSMVLWALLLYRLFADKDLTFRWAIGVMLFTALRRPPRSSSSGCGSPPTSRAGS